jgi:ribosomal protein S10
MGSSPIEFNKMKFHFSYDMITKQKKTFEYRFKVEAYDAKILQHLDIVWKGLANILKLELKGPIFMPLKKKDIILLRSPHVNKKAREKFIFKKYRYLYILTYDLEKDPFINQFLFLLQQNAIAGSSVTMQKISRVHKKFRTFSLR